MNDEILMPCRYFGERSLLAVVAKNLHELHARKGDADVSLEERGQRRARQLAEFTKTNGEGSMKRSTDCGLRHLPDASLAFAKLYALAEGARLASQELWC